MFAGALFLLALILVIAGFSGCGEASREEEAVAAKALVETDEVAAAEAEKSTAEIVQVETFSNALGIQTDGAALTDEQYAVIAEAVDGFTENGWQVGFVLTDISTGSTISYNGDLELYSASAIKGPYVLSLLEAGNQLDGTMADAILYSDNDAYAVLRETYGSEVFAEWLASAGVSEEQGAEYYTTTTPADLAEMWLYSYDYLSGEDWVATIFEGTLNSPIYSQLGDSKTVLSKCGWIDEGGYYNSYNDAGIVDDGASPYVLALMSDAPGTEGETEMMALVEALDAVHQQMVESA